MIKKLRKIIIVLLILILFIASNVLISRYLSMKADKKEKYQEIKENTNLIKEIIIEFEKDYEVLEDQDIQDLDYLNFSKELIKRLNKKYNTDKIIAFLDTGEAGIREIIAFDPNSDFFDRRNIKGEYEYSGTLFLYKENESITDPYINIFGHSMQDKTRLGKLLDYPTNKESLVKANLFTNEGIYQYELVQVSEIDTVSDDDYLTWQKDDFFRFYEDSSKSGLIEQLEKPDVEASYMLLNTCADLHGNKKRIAIYKLIKVKDGMKE